MSNGAKNQRNAHGDQIKIEFLKQNVKSGFVGASVIEEFWK
jgi:hypothetical protein